MDDLETCCSFVLLDVKYHMEKMVDLGVGDYVSQL